MRIRFLAITGALLVAAMSTSRWTATEAALQPDEPPAAEVSQPTPGSLTEVPTREPRVALLRQPASAPSVEAAPLEPKGDTFQFRLRARGTLFDFDGQPVPRGRIGFELEADQDRIPTAYGNCDAQGQFDLPIGPGTWQVVYAGEPGHQGGRLALTQITVQDSAESAYFDFYLPGSRQVAGAVFREDQDHAHLELEIFDLADPSQPVATAFCSTNEASHAEYLAALEHPDQDAPPAAHSPGRGRFEIAGLPPGHYQLRAYMDIGKKYYVWHNFDVTGSDYEFPPVAVEQRDFLAHAEIQY